MPVPLPAAEHAKVTLPDAAEVELLARGVATVAAGSNGLTEIQRLLIEAIFPAMTHHPVDVASLTPLDPAGLARALAERDEAFRTRILQIAILCSLVLRPLPGDVVDQLSALAAELSVGDGMIDVAHQFSTGALGLAAFDFERNGYTSTWHPEDAAELHASHALTSAWEQVTHDPELAARWEALGSLPPGTLGRRVWELYRARGFAFPGTPGSAPPLLAQHDWVHVLADYGTTVESELEVFAFIERANDDMHAFSLLAMTISLFETGYLRTAAGLFEYSPGHLAASGMAVRVADAMRRGAFVNGSIDFMRVDWFELAQVPVEELRARFGVWPKSEEAIAAGSVTPWEPGGISAFQRQAGEAAAARDGRLYDSFGA